MLQLFSRSLLRKMWNKFEKTNKQIPTTAKNVCGF